MDIELNYDETSNFRFKNQDFDFFSELSKDTLALLNKNQNNLPKSKNVNSFIQEEDSAFLDYLKQSLNQRLNS